jgi:HAD superfamily hydrolase (TIGR01509 family)
VPSLQGLILDLDGLLIDSETWSWQAHNEVLASLGAAPLHLDEVRLLVGLDSEDEWQALLALRPLQVDPHAYSAAQRAAFSRLRAALLAPMPGVLSLLGSAADYGLRLGLASNSHRPSIDAALQGLGIQPAFAAIASADDVPRGKPAPDVYTLCLERLDLHPSLAAAVEDSRAGLLAARAAGLFAIAVPNALTATQDLSPANLRLPSLFAVAQWLEGQ